MNSTLNRRLAQTSTGVALLPCPRLHRLQTVPHSPIQAAAPCPARAAVQLMSLTSSRAVAAAAGRQAEAASATNDRKRTRLAADKSPELIDPQLLAPIPMVRGWQLLPLATPPAEPSARSHSAEASCTHVECTMRSWLSRVYYSGRQAARRRGRATPCVCHCCVLTCIRCPCPHCVATAHRVPADPVGLLHHSRCGPALRRVR